MGCINSKKAQKDIVLDEIPAKDNEPVDRPLPPQPMTPPPHTPTLSQKCESQQTRDSFACIIHRMLGFVAAVVILKALYDYEPRQTEDLGFKKNDRLELVNDRSDLCTCDVTHSL